jgi:hypothetical protein
MSAKLLEKTAAMPPPPAKPTQVLNAAMIPPPPVKTLSKDEILRRLGASLKSKILAASSKSQGPNADKLAMFLKNA